VSAGKSVWQVPQGCPVCRAKLGKACAGVINPIVDAVIDIAANTSAAKSHLPFVAMTL
jgi:hypothetical protein